MLVTTVLQFRRPKAGREPTPELLRRIDALAEGMAAFWGKHKPSSLSITEYYDFGSGMLDIGNPPPALLKPLRGSRLIDLGAGGPGSYMPMSHFAAVARVSEFLIVDRYQDYSGAIKAMGEFVRSGYPDIAFGAFEDDMLRHLARQPDSSANICMNAIDTNMLGCRDKNVQDEYIRELLAQISRVVPDGGVAFGLSSPLLHNLVRLGFKAISEPPGIILAKSR
jgi:hypothetical protein